MRFAVFGAGFWAPYQLAAWGEVPGARCVALYNRTPARAENLAQGHGVPAVFDDPERLLCETQPDFVDVITAVETHAQFVRLAAAHGIPVVCQKPMATSLAEAESMVDTCRRAGVPFLVHENWRWQAPLRHLKSVLDSGAIGTPFRARLEFNSSFPVFDNQPFLKTLPRFMLTDMGSHILDVARFLFGEMDRLYCQTRRVHPDIAGEDVATVLLHSRAGVTVTVELSYASRTEKERFPETFVHIEGDSGSLELAPNHWVRLTTPGGTEARRVPPTQYAWSAPAYALVHAGMVACNANLLAGLRGESAAETTGADNLETVRLVFAAYDSADSGRSVEIAPK